MNRVIDAANGLVIEWDTDKLVVDESGISLPQTFVAKVDDVDMTYDNGHLVSIEGDDIDLSALVPLDRKARQLVAHTPDGELLPPKVDSPARKPSKTQYTDEFLQEVAEAFSSDGYPGVQARFDVGRRQAARYISRARDAGVIER